MAYLAQILLAGIVTGSLYSLIALGFAIIYKTTKVANLAHGDIAMLGAYFAVQVFVIMNMGTAAALLLLIPFSFIVGAAIGLFLNIPLKQNRIANIVIASLGMGIILQEVVVLKFGAFPFFLKGLLPEKTLDIGGASIQYGNFLIIGITLMVMAIMFIFFNFTELGIAMRAVSQNREASLVMGINPTVMVLSSWGLASVIGMISCFLLSSQLGAYPELGVTVIIKAFTAAVLGGLTSLPGAVLGAFIVGIIDSLLAGYISGELQTIGAFFILLIVLLIRPEGIFSGKMRAKV
jgi:branched-chain amino acid transport system permease protein